MNDRDGLPTERSGLALLPRTVLGWWAFGLCITFFLLFSAWCWYIAARPIPRPTFFSDPIHAALILGADLAALVGGGVALGAVVARRERSLAAIGSILIGAFILMLTLAEIFGEH